MSSSRGLPPLSFRRIGTADLASLATLELEPVERFIEPVTAILDAVRRGPAHSLVAIERAGEPIGFYVVHPDRRDSTCWWLGWLAIGWRFQGGGLGGTAMAAAMARLRRIGCRRIRLLVAPDNEAALRLYRRVGFEVAGIWAPTGEWIMDCVSPGPVPEQERLALVANAYTLLQAMWLRLWRRGAPPAAKLSGEFHGPPTHVGFGVRAIA
jgi:RimJ/RimL family protein N-acetyltransferase